MIIVTSNPANRLLLLSYNGQVVPGELNNSFPEVRTHLALLSPDFRLLVDFTHLESMHIDCAQEIGQLMEICDQAGVGLVVRVITDPKKDIGMSILSLFHYRQLPQIVNCPTLAEAIDLLKT